MSYEFKELDYQQTPYGEISLRRRAEPRLDGKILYEVKLGEEFLMSSLFTEAEQQLATMALATLQQDNLDVVVGGLGLGYTAMAALKNPTVRWLEVIDVMAPVIDWHRRGLVPLGEVLTADPRCSLVLADFFELASSPDSGLFTDQPDQLAHAVLLDIDHSPSYWLNPENGQFYTSQGLKQLVRKIHPGGIFGLWSNELPDSEFVSLLEEVFTNVEARIVSFPNPYSGGESSNTVYLSHTRG